MRDGRYGGVQYKVTGKKLEPTFRYWSDSDEFSKIIKLYPAKGEFTLYYPASTGSGYAATYKADDPWYSFEFHAETAEEALAKAMDRLTQMGVEE